ncbi:MAG: hypothetical protein ACP5HZ_12605 [Ferrimicrobium sp.]
MTASQSPLIVRNPGFSCSVTVAKPHISQYYLGQGRLFVDTHTYVGCSESASTLQAIATLYVLTEVPTGDGGVSGEWVAQAPGVSKVKENVSSIVSPQSNFDCENAPLNTLPYYGASGYAYVNNTYQASSNSYLNTYVSCTGTTPALRLGGA